MQPIPKQDQEITEDVKLLRTSSLTLDAAIYKYIQFNEREPQQWHIGITSDVIVMLDIDEHIPLKEAIDFANRIQNLIEHRYKAPNEVMVNETTNGYHIVSNAKLSHQQWAEIYQALYNRIQAKDPTLPPLDEMHILLSIKYGKTTLRISNKHGDYEIYKTLYITKRR